MEQPTSHSGTTSIVSHGDAERRTSGAWSVFIGGQAAIGGNLFVALGLVVLAARGSAALCFAAAGVVFLLVGLATIELASAYPVAGGGHFFVQRALGDFWGFVAGSALLLDLTVGIALFATISASYVNTFSPALLGIEARELSLHSEGLGQVEWLWLIEALVITGLLVAANCRGSRERSGFGSAVGVAALTGLGILVTFGFLFAWRPEVLLRSLTIHDPGVKGFAYGLSLAIISFVGLQTIASTAAECRRPASVVPRPFIALVLITLLFAVGISILAVGVLPEDPKGPARIFGHGEAPISAIANTIPFFGPAFAGVMAALACAVLLASANSYFASLSRLMFSMGQRDALGDWARRIHPRLNVPLSGLVAFGCLLIVEILAAFLWPNAEPIEVLANMYAFGATLAYALVMIAFIRLRFLEPHYPRPYKMPLSVPLWIRGKKCDLPILAIAGLAGVLLLFTLVIATHEIGRVAGSGWMLASIAYYIVFRKLRGIPLLGSVPRDWVEEQEAILRAAGEDDRADAYRRAMAKGGPITPERSA